MRKFKIRMSGNIPDMTIEADNANASSGSGMLTLYKRTGRTDVTTNNVAVFSPGSWLYVTELPSEDNIFGAETDG